MSETPAPPLGEAELAAAFATGAPLRGIMRGQLAAARAELGIAADEFAIGTITRLHDSKGNNFLVEAAAKVVQERPKARFFLVGEGPLLPDLEAQARALNLGDRFVFAGFRRDVAATLSATEPVSGWVARRHSPT